MKLIKLKLHNFRGYKDEVFKFNDMTAICGKNDAGKSTILEALDIFFNEENKNQGIIKIDSDDMNIKHCDDNLSISCVFKVCNNSEIIIDSSNKTTFEDEYLLNADGNLEIKKEWTVAEDKIRGKKKVYLYANYPDYKEQTPAINMKISDLKKAYNNVFETKNKTVNFTKKADIRRELNKYYSDKNGLKEQYINLSNLSDEDKNMWQSISNLLPNYFLFQSDRKNMDSDEEVQGPLKAALRIAVQEEEKEIQKIIDRIVDKVKYIGDETVKKLSEFDAHIAKNLYIDHNEKALDSLFSFSIKDENGISINKRGSGIRRLILLSYFRIQAEKHLDNNIIYAIEEPETAQHPNFQKIIMDTFQKLAKDNQVLFTTHTPEIVKMINIEDIIFIDRTNDGSPYVESIEDLKVEKVVNSLGILPSALSKTVICVEGENDVNFLRGINNIAELKDIIDLSNISIIPMNGSKLCNWIDQDYLKGSSIKEYHLYDSDVKEYIDKINEINSSHDSRRMGRNTKLREMENYIPLEVIEEIFKDDNLSVPLSIDEWKNQDVPKYLCNKVMLNIKNNSEREKAIKIRLNKATIRISKEELQDYGIYDEVKDWFQEIAYFANNN